MDAFFFFFFPRGVPSSHSYNPFLMNVLIFKGGGLYVIEGKIYYPPYFDQNLNRTNTAEILPESFLYPSAHRTQKQYCLLES